MEKRIAQVTAKTTEELKEKAIQYCRTHDISESDLINIALIHYFFDVENRGLVKMYATVIGA